MNRITCLTLYLLCSSPLLANTENEQPLQWQEWSTETFKKAKQENKLILLDLDAVWCHWCHVMDATTYTDPEVLKEINTHFIPVRVDHAANPELADRYEDYGWPATIIFSTDGTEIIKRRGYIRPDLMKWMLQAVAENPDPSAHENKIRTISPSTQSGLSNEQKELLKMRYQFIYDAEFGGWGRVYKFLHNDSLEYAMTRAIQGSKAHEIMARQTLWAAQQLIDPEWGGIYQYSDSVDWKSLHFKKIMSSQTDALHLYSMGYGLWGTDEHLESALKIFKFLEEKLSSPEGIFYTSQNTDLNANIDGHHYFTLSNKQRLELGIPPIDKNIYARENAWVASALLSLYGVTTDKKHLDKAIHIVNWIIVNRKLPESGGYAHGTNDTDIFLGDTLAVGTALLELYAATANPRWLNLAEQATEFISATFKNEKGGYASTPAKKGKSLLQSPSLHRDSQIRLTRFTRLLSFVTGKEKYQAMAEHTMKHLVSVDITNQHRLLAGVLLTDMEMSRDPLHITIIGNKQDKTANKLFETALKSTTRFKRVEWWDKAEGPLPNPDVTYPKLDNPAAFICTNGACSAPIYEPEKMGETIEKMKFESSKNTL